MTPTFLTSWTGRRAGGLVALACALVLLAAASGTAQDSDLRSLAQQMGQLQRELSDLQRTVYGGAPMPAGAADTNLAASQEVRIQQLQSQMSGLTGQIEELGYQVQRLQERVDSLANAMGGMMHGGAGTPVAEAPAVQPLGQGAGAAPDAPAAATAPQTATAPEHTFQSQLQAGTTGGPAATTDAQPQALTAPQAAATPTGPYTLPGDTPDEQYQYAFGLLRQANYPEAEQALKTFIERNPASPLAGNAQYWLGETYYVRGDYQNAAVAFAEGYQKYPDSGKAPDNLLKLGMSLGEIGSAADACTALKQLDTQFPGAPGNIKERAARERTRLGC